MQTVERIAPNANFVYVLKFATTTPTGLELIVPKNLTTRKFWFATGINTAGDFMDGTIDFTAGGVLVCSLPFKQFFSAATGGPDIHFGGSPILATRIPAIDAIYFTNPGQTSEYAVCPLILNVTCDKIVFTQNRFNGVGGITILMACLSMSPL